MDGWFANNIPTVITLGVFGISGTFACGRLLERQKNFESATNKKFEEVEKDTRQQFEAVEQHSGSKLETLTRAIEGIAKDVKVVVAWMNWQKGIEEGRRIGRRHDDDVQTGELT
jgi:hypothetical protein